MLCCACYKICTSRFTNCAACREICSTSRFTKCCACRKVCTKCSACHEICTLRFTKCCACHEICTSRFTKCCACHKIWSTKYCACHEICKQATCPKVTIHCTCHGIRAPRRSRSYPKCWGCHELSAFRSRTARSLAPVTKKLSLELIQSTRFPLCLPRKVTMSENAHGATTRASRDKHPPRPPRFCELAQSTCREA